MDRINLLHLSDIHIKEANASERRILLDALSADLSRLKNSGRHPSLVVFSGDLAYTGSDHGAYTEAITFLCETVLKPLDLDLESTIVVPGNHDASRDFVEKNLAALSKAEKAALDGDTLASADLDNAWNRLIHEKFKVFEDFADEIAPKSKVAWNSVCKLYDFPSFNTSILAANSAISTRTGIDGVSDEAKLILPHGPIFDLSRKIPHDRKKVFVMHHPLSWLDERCRNRIETHISHEFDAVLFGHMHIAKPSQITMSSGITFLNQSGALFQGGNLRRWNGYSIVSISLSTNHVESHFRTFVEERREFVEDLSVGVGGTFFSSEGARHYWTKHHERIDNRAISSWVSNNYLPQLLGTFESSINDKPLDKIFVEPPLSRKSEAEITDARKRKEEAVPVGEILNLDRNWIVVAGKDHGKTSFLRYLAIQIAKDSKNVDGHSPKVPVYINFDDIRLGRDQLERLIRGQLMVELPGSISLDLLLDAGRLVLIIDDVDLEDEKRFNYLKSFISLHSSCRFVLCLSNELQTIMGDLVPELPVSVHKVFLHSFSRNKLRALVTNWASTSGNPDRDKLLDQIVRDLVVMNLPFTGVTGSLLLSAREREPGFKPINRAVLINQLLESLLGKHLVDQVFRETFDFENQAHYLSSLAEYMCRNDKYTLELDQITAFTKEYLQNYAFNRPPKQLVEIFIGAKVLEHTATGIRFKFRAFLEFFVALRMSKNAPFYHHVMSEENYLQYVNEIDYFSAIKRESIDLLKLLTERFQKLNQEVVGAGEWWPDVAKFDNLRLDEATEDSMIKEVARVLNIPTLTDEERDEQLEAEIPRDIGRRQEVNRLGFSANGAKWLAALEIMSRVTRNLEHIEAGEKQAHVNLVLERWSEFCANMMTIAPSIAKQRKIVINGVRYAVTFGDGLSDKDLLFKLYYSIPHSVARVVQSNLGSEKLEGILRTPLRPDEKAIVTFFRSLLAADLRIAGYSTILEFAATKLVSNGYLSRVLLQRVRYLFQTGSDSDQAAVRGLLVGMLKRSAGASGSESRVSHEVEKLQRDRLILQVQARADRGDD